MLSRDFKEKVGILLLTGALTGLVVPYVLKQIDEASSLERMRAEAQLTRQSRVIEAQSKFLDETIEAAWAWRYLSMKVAFNGSERREEQYAAAAKEYESEIWTVLARLRNQASKSRRLISERGYQRLVSVYDKAAEFDARLDIVVRAAGTSEQRAAALTPLQRELRVDLTKMVDETLDMLAGEVQLKAVSTSRR